MRRIVHLAFAALCVLAAATASAQDFPSRAIRLVVPYPPGGPTDLVARIYAGKMGEIFGQPVVVENRPGGIGTIGLNLVARATPDGHTFGLMAMPSLLAPTMLPSVPFDIVADLAPVIQTNWESHLLVVRASSP